MIETESINSRHEDGEVEEFEHESVEFEHENAEYAEYVVEGYRKPAALNFMIVFGLLVLSLMFPIFGIYTAFPFLVAILFMTIQAIVVGTISWIWGAVIGLLAFLLVLPFRVFFDVKNKIADEYATLNRQNFRNKKPEQTITRAQTFTAR